MYDNAIYYSKLAAEKINLKELYNLESCEYILCTIHRNQNTDNPESLANIVEALLVIAESNKIFLPLHPRTRQAIQQLPMRLKNHFISNKNIIINPPVGFLEMISLEQHARFIMTDSGGVQKEAFFFSKPCIILRAETEWTEIVESGRAILAGSSKEKIIAAFRYFAQKTSFEGSSVQRKLYGEGNAAHEILGLIKKHHY
ncbi:MAG: UDP-GlcNAc3NAcA epimerase [Psychroserpens sp.]|jgi:UDP-GlcNAc3NAcA epimerase